MASDFGNTGSAAVWTRSAPTSDRDDAHTLGHETSAPGPRVVAASAGTPASAARRTTCATRLSGAARLAIELRGAVKVDDAPPTIASPDSPSSRAGGSTFTSQHGVANVATLPQANADSLD